LIHCCLLLRAYWYLKKTATPVPLSDRKVPNSAVAATAAGLVAATLLLSYAVLLLLVLLPAWLLPPSSCPSAVMTSQTQLLHKHTIQPQWGQQQRRQRCQQKSQH
jgi:hypothetical protein